MRILHVVQYFSPGGLEKFVWNLALEQKTNGHEVGIYVYDDKREWVSAMASLGITVHTPTPKKDGVDFNLVFKLDEVAVSYDVIHSHDIGPLVYCGLLAGLKKIRGEKRKFIHTVHGLVHVRNNLRYRFYEKIFMPWMDHVVAVSSEIKKFYSRKTTLIENGIPVSPNKTIQTPNLRAFYRPELIGKLKLNFEKKIAIHVARIFPLKDQKTLVEAFNQMPDYELLIVGPVQDETYAQELKSMARTNVHFLGARTDIVELMLGSDLYVSASTEEGLSISLLEAMSVGLPLLLSDIQGHRDLTKNGEFSVYFKGASELKAKLSQVKSGEAGFKHILENYSMSKVLHKYLELYRL